MPEPHTRRETPYDFYGILAEFKEPDDLMKAARRARQEGFRAIDAFSPFPIEGLAEAIGFRDSRVPIATLVGGILGAASGYGLQVYTNLDYPLNVGGRPIIAPTAFMLITFELLVLFAVLFGIGAMFACNRLPRLHHPLFEVDTFHLASLDKFFLVIFSNDVKFDPEKTRRFLQSLGPECIRDVPFTGAPE
jgi:hypothetical protein